MNDIEEKEILIETILFDTLRAFHDGYDGKKLEDESRKLFEDFCLEHNINKQFALNKLKKMFENRRENTIFEYEKFTDLDSILMPKKEEPRNTNPDFDDDAR